MARLKGKNEEITGKLDPKYWVQKSDPLVLMRSVPFSLGELKILDTYISRINAADDTRRTVIFTKEEYEELMGLTCADYRALKKNTEGLLGKVVTLEMPDKEYLQFVLFEQAQYHKDEYGKPIVELTCTPRAKELFFCIGKYHYFKYALENVINLTRKASYLLYLYIRQNRYRCEWDINLDELRNKVLDCKEQESYQAFKEFRRAVFEPAVKEINTKTDCHFNYEAIKRGRTVIKIKFIYQSQTQSDLEYDENQLTLDDINEQSEDDKASAYSSDTLSFLAQACNYEFTDTQMKEIFAIISTMDIPKHMDSIDLGRYQYLSKMYAALNSEAERKAQRKEKINNRFTYFIGMLKGESK